jgi:hypothetical protein
MAVGNADGEVEALAFPGLFLLLIDRGNPDDSEGDGEADYSRDGGIYLVETVKDFIESPPENPEAFPCGLAFCAGVGWTWGLSGLVARIRRLPPTICIHKLFPVASGLIPRANSRYHPPGAMLAEVAVSPKKSFCIRIGLLNAQSNLVARTKQALRE